MSFSKWSKSLSFFLSSSHSIVPLPVWVIDESACSLASLEACLSSLSSHIIISIAIRACCILRQPVLLLSNSLWFPLATISSYVLHCCNSFVSQSFRSSHFLLSLSLVVLGVVHICIETLSLVEIFFKVVSNYISLSNLLILTFIEMSHDYNWSCHL